MWTLRNPVRLLPVVLAAVLWSETAAAQKPTAPPDTLPALEVVATRTPEAPHDVAASVEVIRGVDLEARGVRTLREALTLAAGVAIAPGGDAGPAGAVPELWGLREFDAFLLVVDGIPWGGALNPDLASLALADVERIEILRGPAPVTYGATSFVGVIQVTHRNAGERSEAYSASVGSYGSLGLAATLSLPGASWNHRASAEVDRERLSGEIRPQYHRGHALWRSSKTAGDRTTWLLGDLTILRQDPASPHPRQGTALSTAVPLDANHNPAGAFLDQDRFTVSAGHQRQLGQAIWGSQLALSHSAQKIFRGFLTELSEVANNASGFRENIDINDLYADSHLIWASSSAVRVLAGADLLFANGEARGATFNYSVPLAGSTAPAVTQPSVLDKDAEDRRIFVGAYGSIEWRPVERLTLSGGLRLNATSERRGEGASVSHNKLSGSLGAVVGVWARNADHVRLFANYRSTFKPAAFDFGLAENEGILEPETSQSYEGGAKARLADGRLDLEASLFRMDFSNLVTSTVIDNLPALINAGETRFQGFEVVADLRVHRQVSARASYSFHDGKFVDFVQSFDGVPTQLAGNRFEMSARHLASAGVTVTPGHGFSVHGNLNYTGNRYLNKRNSALADGFLTVDAGIGHRFGQAEVRIDGRNLTDRRDPISESEFGDAQYYRMTPRTVRVGVTLRR